MHDRRALHASDSFFYFPFFFNSDLLIAAYAHQNIPLKVLEILCAVIN